MAETRTTSITRRTALKSIAGVATIGGVSGIVATGGDVPDDLAGPLFDDSNDDDDDPGACDFSEIFTDTVGSIVTVRVFDEGTREFAQGSGWVYDVDGSTADVVTNWHVLFGSAGADVRFGTGDWRSVTGLHGADPYSDLAILRVEDAPEIAEPISIVDETPEEGDEVAALGSPIGLDRTITTGIVSSADRSTTVSLAHFMYNVPSTIQMDAATNPGNSGGPLVDCNGEVVGVNFAGAPPLVAENVNFAVSESMVQRIVPELIETGTFEHPYVGIRGVTISPMMSRLNDRDETTEGVYVDRTVDGFPGNLLLEGTTAIDQETGISLGGDVIVAVNETDIGDADALRNYLFEETSPEETVALSIYRDGFDGRQEIDVTLEARPEELERIGVEEPTM
ncbi:S1C family serine protease [Natrialbaceae archaeon A-gly3]